MTEEEPQDQGEGSGEVSKGSGCVLGGLATIGVGVLGGVIWIVAGGTGVLAPIGWLLPIALLIGVAYYFRKMPGFLLGVGLTVAIQLVIGGACAAILINSFG